MPGADSGIKKYSAGSRRPYWAVVVTAGEVRWR
jgi:hypothetical protein